MLSRLISICTRGAWLLTHGTGGPQAGHRLQHRSSLGLDSRQNCSQKFNLAFLSKMVHLAVCHTQTSTQAFKWPATMFSIQLLQIAFFLNRLKTTIISHWSTHKPFSSSDSLSRDSPAHSLALLQSHWSWLAISTLMLHRSGP